MRAHRRAGPPVAHDEQRAAARTVRARGDRSGARRAAVAASQRAFIAARTRAARAACPTRTARLLLCDDRLGVRARVRRDARCEASTALLPPSHAPRCARAHRARCSEPAFALVDRAGCRPAAAGDRRRSVGRRRAGARRSARSTVDHVAALVYTSGTTGEPHAAREVLVVARARRRAHCVVASACKPAMRSSARCRAQHMWGLEATVMLPLQGGGVDACRRPAAARRTSPPRSRAHPARRWLVADAAASRAAAALRGVALPALVGALTATSPLERDARGRIRARDRRAVDRDLRRRPRPASIATRRPAPTSAFTPLDGLERRVAAMHGLSFAAAQLDADRSRCGDRVTLPANGASRSPAATRTSSRSAASARRWRC